MSISIPPRKKRIAFLVNDLSGAYQARFLQSIEKATRRHDLGLLVLCGREVGHPDPHERAQNTLYTEWLGPHAVDGVIVLAAAMANFSGTHGMVALCQSLRPLPVCSIGLAVPDVPSIVIDNRSAMRLSVDHLIQHHRRKRVAYVSGPADNEEAAARLAGYEDALRDAGLPYDPALVAFGHFTPSTGRDAMQEILGRTRDVDALASANDDMAMGACDVLREHQLSISDEVLVIGFDNSPMSRYTTRSLTSVAQPMDQMADAAVSEILSLIEGREASIVRHLDVHLVLRESCGCGYIVRSHTTSRPLVEDGASVVEYLRRNERALVQQLQPETGTSRELWPRWAPLLVRALNSELLGQSGTFLRVVEEVAEDAARQGVSIDEVSRAVTQLRAEFQALGEGEAGLHLERIWMKALAILAAATTRIEGRAALDVQVRANELRFANQRLSIALDAEAIAAALAPSLPKLGIETAVLAVHPSSEKDWLEPLLVLSDGRRLAVPKLRYESRRLLPSSLERAERCSLLLMTLTFESDVLGLVAFDTSADAFVYEALRSQISATLRLAELHRRVLEETTLRERLTHQQLLSEMNIAKRLQTALAPKRFAVPGLQISAVMLPADEVGGDYYDVLPTENGAWIGVGDVTGHGLLSGLIMLMIQSSVSALCGTRPNARPSELVTDLNRVLFPNIRERLEQDEHATLLLMHYEKSGHVVFAGAHEDVVLWRKRTRTAELVPTTGVWLGIKADIGAATLDQSLELEPGDVLVLYTDGVIEARNSQGELFGIERLSALVEAAADLEVSEIQAQIVSAARGWSPRQEDDVTCLVARYAPSALTP